MKRVLMGIGLLFSMGSQGVGAAEYPLPTRGGYLIGENIIYQVPNDGKSLEDIAAHFQVGLLAMLEANPDVDPYLPQPGSVLTIPSQMLLPNTPREGIVINLAELRLYYYPKGKKRVLVYPIGIGQLGRNTPEMVTTVVQLIKDPTWTPTVNIRKRYEEEGIILPTVMPAGPDNPMGRHALRLAAHGGVYLLHGTNANFGIGMRVSSGCIRLRPEDIEALFDQVPLGTRVQIINEPIKVSIEPDGKHYVEVHQPLSDHEMDDPQTKLIVLNDQVNKFIASPLTQRKTFEREFKRRSGIPVVISDEM